MARKGRYDHLKPEILRLLTEGVTQAEILRQYPDLAKATLSDWSRSVPVQNISELSTKSPRAGLPIDPESPIEKIRNALWDIVYDQQGKGAAVQALNILLKSEAPWIALGQSQPDDDDNGKPREIKVTRRIIDADS